MRTMRSQIAISMRWNSCAASSPLLSVELNTQEDQSQVQNELQENHSHVQNLKAELAATSDIHVVIRLDLVKSSTKEFTTADDSGKETEEQMEVCSAGESQ